MKKLLKFLILATFLAGLTIPHNSAQEDFGEEIKLYLGETRVLSVSNPKRIAIGNPAIVDVTNATKQELTLAPKAAGSTTLVIWDNFGQSNYRVNVYSEDTGLIKKRIDNLLSKLKLPDITTKAEDVEGKVFITGTIKSQQDKEKIASVLSDLKGKYIDLTETKDSQTVVEIDVQVLDITKGSADTLGFTWPSSINIREIVSPGVSQLSAGTTFGKLFKLGTVERATSATAADPFTLRIDALIKEGKARVLSRPRLACLSGKEAKLLIGGEVPVLSATMSTGGSGAETPAATPGNVEYKEYGIRLEIKPTVDEQRRIHLNLFVEVSEYGSTVTTSYALAYLFTRRNASTELFLDDGQTMAIAGLIKQKTQEDLTKVPWLADVPVLGAFFRKRVTSRGGDETKREDNELFIILTPRIVSEPKTKEEIAQAQAESLVKAEPEVTDEQLQDPLARYTYIVQQRILANLGYPAEARNAGFQGQVKLSLRLSHKGELLEAKVKSSSGYKILDDNAINVAQGVSSFPPFPPAVEKDELWIEVPVKYKLD